MWRRGVIWSIHRYCISSLAFWFYPAEIAIYTGSPGLSRVRRCGWYLRPGHPIPHRDLQHVSLESQPTSGSYSRRHCFHNRWPSTFAQSQRGCCRRPPPERHGRAADRRRYLDSGLVWQLRDWVVGCVFVFACLFVSFVCVFASLFVCLFVSSLLFLCVCWFLCLFVCLLLCLFVCLLLCFFVCLFVSFFPVFLVRFRESCLRRLVCTLHSSHR